VRATAATPFARIAALAIAFGALLATSACATPTPASQNPAEPAMANPSRSTEDCMFSVVVKDWAGIDEQRFIIYGLTQHEPYLGKLFFPTPDLVNNVGMFVVDDDHNGRICGQSGDWVQFQNPTIPGRNLITSLRKITDEEAKSLLAEAKPKPRKQSKAPKAPEPDKPQ
jgi:Family of unknown function (DUF6491)